MVMVNGLQAPQHIATHIKNASMETGIDFSYLVNQARAESSFDPSAKAKSSSATGLYQFIESTWLRLSEKHGEKYGLAGLSQGEILERRNDPKTVSLMAAELARENKAHLERTISGNGSSNIGATELYFAHFLGAKGAENFLNAKNADGDTKAAYLFPAAAKANKNVFFNKDGSSKTLNQIYDHFAAKFNKTDNKSRETQLAEVNIPAPQKLSQSQPNYVPSRSSYMQMQHFSPPSALYDFAPDIQKLVMSSYFMDMQMLDSFSRDSDKPRQNFTGQLDYSLFE